MKLSLGTVQLGMPYGINNSGVPENNEIKKIFAIAAESGIRILDTAPAYGDAEIKIGQLAGQKFKIVTKFPSVKSEEELFLQLTNSLNRLKTNSIYGYLAHNSENLLTHPRLWQSLIQAKNEKKVEKIGYSLYSCEQLEKLLELNIIPDLVQLPYSILDRKFEIFFPVLKKLGTEIHVRSVFLQGLYFMNPSSIPVKLKSLKPNLQELDKCCKEFEIPVSALALNFVLENKFINQAVIGIDTASQLQQNIEMAQGWKYNQALLDRLSEIEVIHKELLNPVNW